MIKEKIQCKKTAGISKKLCDAIAKSGVSFDELAVALSTVTNNFKKEQEIVIHLGLHKTGTTFLQKCVFPKLKDVEVQHLMNICQIKFASHKKTLLISSEGLLSSMPHYPDNNTVEDSIEALYRIYPNAKIIMGVRNERSWFISCWNQYIRSGGVLSFSEYLMEYGGNCLLPREYIALMEFKTIEYMCKFMGVPIPIFDITTANKSFSKNKICILRFINHWTFGIYNKIYAKIISWQ